MKRTALFAIVVLCAAAGPAIAFDRWVPFDHLTIQDAINSCNPGDTVWVYRDTYSGVGNRDIDFGGRAITVKSSDGPETCTIDCGDSGRAFYFHSGEGADSVVEGFTIRNGYVGEKGGAIYCESSSPTITNCIITDNSALSALVDTSGGGIYCQNASPTITDCTISDNSATFGGGIYCNLFSSPIIDNCVIKNNNTAEAKAWPWIFGGGGVYCEDSSPLISNCTISDNSAMTISVGIEGYGGGVACEIDSSAVIVDCVVTGNLANYGGGISCYASSSADIINCNISNNVVEEGDGGGMLLAEFDSGEVTNCVISGNSAEYSGGGVELYSSSMEITNCIISGNSSGFGSGGAVDCYGASPRLVNCTISSNMSLDGYGGGISCEERAGTPSTPIITNCTLASNTEQAIFEVDDYSDPTVTYCLFHNNSPDGDYWDWETGLKTGADAINGLAEAHDNIEGNPLLVMDGPDGISGQWTADPNYDSGIERTILADSLASFIEDELVGKHVNADTMQREQFLITANTPTTIEVIGEVPVDVLQEDEYKIIDYHIREGSVCINAGDSGVVKAGQTDIDGQPRVMYGRVDVGVDEFYNKDNVGDFTGDAEINFLDYVILANAWSINDGEPGWNPLCDLSVNGTIDQDDLSIFVYYWLGEALLAPAIEVEQTFLSIASEDGRVWDDGSGIGVNRNSTDSGNLALRLGDWAGPLGYRTILSFDTSSLPGDAVIVSARLEMTRGLGGGTDPFTWEGNSCDIDIASPLGASFALEASDWQAAAAVTNVASFSYPADPGSEQQMVSDDFNAGGLANINADGKTQLRVYFTIPNNGPSGNDYLGFYSADDVTVSKWPRLVIRYQTRTPAFDSIASEDGRVWDAGSGTGILNNSTDSDDIALRLGDWAGPYGYKTILSFETSILPDDCEIISAWLEMNRGFSEGTDPFTWEGNSCDIDIASPFGADFILENADWQAAADSINIASFSYLADPGNEQKMLSDEFNAAGLSNISKTGSTQLRVYFTVPNNGPSGNDYLGLYSGDSEYPQKRPKLIISYE